MTDRNATQDFDVARAEQQLSEIMETDNPDDDAMAFELVHGISRHKVTQELSAAESRLGTIMEIDNPDDDEAAFELMRKINHLRPRV